MLTAIATAWDASEILQLGCDKMASIAAPEPGLSAALADALVPASIFAPDRGGGFGDEDGDECLEDGDMMNGSRTEERLDFTSKVARGRPADANASRRC